jgi:hypothetical protein
VRFWKRDDELERRLRADRPQPRDEFLQSLAKRLRMADRPRLALRVGLAAGLTAVFVIALASVGGLGQSAHAIGSAFNVARVSDRHDNDDRHNKPDKDQYKHERKACIRAAKGDFQAAVRTAQRQFQDCRDQAKRDYEAAKDACGKRDKLCQKAAEDNYDAAKRRCEQQYRDAIRAAEAQYRAAKQACKDRFPR